MREIKLFRSAKLVGVNVDPDRYIAYGPSVRGQKDFVMSRGALADFVKCPSKWRAGYESKETNATKWGSLIDTLALSPETFDDRFAVYPETYQVETKKCPKCDSVSDAQTCSCTGKRIDRVPFTATKPWNNKAKVCDEWKTKRHGKCFLHAGTLDDDGGDDDKFATYGNAKRAIARLRADDRIASLIDCSQKQVMVTAEYHDSATGIVVPFKTLLDLVPDQKHGTYGKTLADFKTARDAEEREFTKAVHSGHYDWQAAIYHSAYVTATDEDRTDFLFAVQENTPPYEPAVWALGETWLHDARMEVISALEFYCGCLANDVWPSYRITSPIESWGALSREAWMLRDIPRPPAFKPLTPSPPKPPLPPQPRPDGKPTLHEFEVTP